MDVNEALSQLGSFGFYQFYVYFISLLPQTFSGLIFLSSVFISATPQFRCLVNDCETSDQTFENISELVLHNSCNRFSVIFNEIHNNCENNLILRETNQTCRSWIYSKLQFQSTIVTEWDLVCDNSWKIPLSQSIFMLGFLLGVVITGYLADRFGRKSLFIYLPSITLISCLATAMAQDFMLFTISTALTAFSIAGMSQNSYIIGIELIGAKYRVLCANLTNVMFAFGSVVLCLIAYYIRDWRLLQVMISVPFCVTLFYYWLLPESIRWQISKGQFNKALTTVRTAAKWNGITLNENKFSGKTEHSYSSKTYGPADLFRHPITRSWTLNLAFVWITNAIIYFGLAFQASNLGSDLYLTFALLSSVDIPMILIAMITNQMFGRKRVLIACYLLASICCLTTIFISHSSLLFTILAVFGKSSIAASYAVVYIYTVELYPTFLRSSGLGVCSMISRFGGIAAPYLIKLSIFGESFPLLFSGFIALVSALFVLNLPETLGKELPENFEDIEKLKSGLDSIDLNEEKICLLNTDR